MNTTTMNLHAVTVQKVVQEFERILLSACDASQSSVQSGARMQIYMDGVTDPALLALCEKSRQSHLYDGKGKKILRLVIQFDTIESYPVGKVFTWQPEAAFQPAPADSEAIKEA